MQTIVHRLEQFMQHFGLNPNTLSDKLGYESPEKLYRLFRKDGAKPSYDIINDIANKFESLNLQWLITGRGEMLGTDPMQAMLDRANQFVPQAILDAAKRGASAQEVNQIVEQILDQHYGSGKDAAQMKDDQASEPKMRAKVRVNLRAKGKMAGNMAPNVASNFQKEDTAPKSQEVLNAGIEEIDIVTLYRVLSTLSADFSAFEALCSTRHLELLQRIKALELLCT
ncbi:MAG: hypothetical protein RL660_476 [Bacteroidota bacterium]|jgi:hypothetical protein